MLSVTKQSESEDQSQSQSVKIIDPNFLDENIEKIDIFNRLHSNQDDSSQNIDQNFSKEVNEEEYKKFLKKIEPASKADVFDQTKTEKGL